MTSVEKIESVIEEMRAEIKSSLEDGFRYFSPTMATIWVEQLQESVDELKAKD